MDAAGAVFTGGGPPDPYLPSAPPVPSGMAPAVAIAAGFDHWCALIQGGGVVCSTSVEWDRTVDVPADVAVGPVAALASPGNVAYCAIMAADNSLW